ncbi:MAG: DUF885 domain-containing protein [Candidatus Thermoplasmatota archaeon]|nr:DUF885 domain-containing protein [Candidatus Thermoplasmatota archaeon]
MKSDADRELEDIVQQVIDCMLEMYPSWGTSLGLHEYDSLMPDGRRETMLQHIAKLKEFREAFQSLDEGGLSEVHRTDRLIALARSDLNIFQLEKLRFWESAPSGVSMVGSHVLSLYMRDFASIGVRLKNITNRLKAAPIYLERVRSFIVDPVRIWTENQIESAERFPGFLSLVSSTGEEVLDENNLSALEEAIAATVESVQDYTSWMKNLLPDAREDFAIGPEKLERLMKLSSIEMPVEEIYSLGKRYLEEEKRKVEGIAKEIRPDATLDEVKELVKADHPKNFEEAMELYRESIEQVREFVVDGDIATMPISETLKIIETPDFLRHLIPHAAYSPPGKFEREQQGVYLVTPVEERTEMLKEHNYAVIGNTSVHEAYPGHHLQLVCSNANPSVVRTIIGATETVEGWAHYCEEMMKEHGYQDSPEARFMQSIDLIWRAARIIVDIDLSTGKMSFDEAVKFLMDEVGMEEPFALAEVKRYTQSQGYQLCYLLGKHLILELRDEVKERMDAEYSERFFHDTILYAGSIPVKFLRLEFDRQLKELGL